jgi:hypothetical protein
MIIFLLDCAQPPLLLKGKAYLAISACPFNFLHPERYTTVNKLGSEFQSLGIQLCNIINDKSASLSANLSQILMAIVLQGGHTERFP